MKTELNAFKFAFLAASVSVVLVGCTEKRHSEPNVDLIQDMMQQPALQPQSHHPDIPGGNASRLPPEGSVPQGFTPYKYKGNPQAAAAGLKNPLEGQMTPEILALGARKFDTYCLVCHGAKGMGDGPVAPKMALKPPSLMSEKVRGLNDGAIFHIITDGQGVMSSYAYQLVDEHDRWAIVNYIRSMQKMSKGN